MLHVEGCCVVGEPHYSWVSSVFFFFMSMTLSLPASSLPYVANNLLEEILLLCGQDVSYGGCGLLVLCDDPGDLFQPL